MASTAVGLPGARNDRHHHPFWVWKMTKRIKNVVCTATIKDIHAWIHASHAVPRYIEAERYVLVAPEKYVPIFKAVSNPRFEVIDENTAAPEFDLKYVEDRMPEKNRPRAGWYYQQLIKIRTLMYLPSDHDDVVLIWDADTIPLRAINFINGNGLIYFKGSEFNPPYFEAIRKLTGLEKNVGFSFIAQCFPIFRGWLDEFIEFIENRHGVPWYDAILRTTDLSEISGFSEYETLGTFLANTRPERLYTCNAPWIRFGKRVCSIERTGAGLVDTEAVYISYENWEADQIPINAVEMPTPNNEGEFIEVFFNKMEGKRAVIQIGANDGVMEDPLFRYLGNEKHNEVFALLVEPLNYYFEKLKKTYIGRPNTLMLKAAAGSGEETRKFYYIVPEIADEMNGDGPPNNWAHGQGSFLRQSVEFWIKQNEFRGEVYRANIDRYLSAICETTVNVVPLRSLELGAVGNRMLVIDVQGAELDVLLGVDWRWRPNWLILEQDMGHVELIREFLVALGYVYICGSANPVWGLAEAPIRFVS